MKRTTKIGLGLLALLVASRLAIALAFPVFDPSEGRYAAICANMAASGDFLVPRFLHEGVYQSFDGKPPLLFQLGGLFCRWFGANEFAVRLPSLLAAAALLALVFFTVNRRYGEKPALFATAVSATSVAFYSAAGFCMTDMLLTFCVGGALLLEDLFNREQRRAYSLGVFALLGLGMLVKGPVALVLFGLPAFLDACVNRRWRTLARHSWVAGPILFLAIAAPWYILMARAKPGFLTYFFLHENLLRFLVHDYGDKYGAGREFFRGMALVWALVVTLPWTPLACYRPGRGFHLPRLRLRTADDEGLLAWSLVGIVGFWSLTSRVPLAYLIPVVPLFAAWLAAEYARPAPATAPLHLPFKLVPAALGLAAAVTVATFAVTESTTGKMPGRLFKRVRADHPRATFAFRGDPPYSAEFYLGSDNLRTRAPEVVHFARHRAHGHGPRLWQEVE